MRFQLIASEVAGGLRRNLSMVVSVILVTFISLTFVGTAILMQAQISQMKGYWYDRAQVAVYFCTSISEGSCNLTEATSDQIDAVEAQLKSPTLAPLINRYEFETREQAFALYQKDFADDAVSDFVTPEFFGGSFRINLKDATQSDVISEVLSGVPGVDEVKDERRYLDPIFAALNAASLTAVGIASLMLIAAVLLIATTIRLSAFSRRKEIGIMRLVGASNRFIQTPFVIEGVISAFVGSMLAAGAIVLIVRFFVQDYLGTNLGSGIATIGLTDAFAVAPILLLIGTVLSALSANIAINRYLKV